MIWVPKNEQMPKSESIETTPLSYVGSIYMRAHVDKDRVLALCNLHRAKEETKSFRIRISAYSLVEITAKVHVGAYYNE